MSDKKGQNGTDIVIFLIRQTLPNPPMRAIGRGDANTNMCKLSLMQYTALRNSIQVTELRPQWTWTLFPDRAATS